MVPKRFEYEDCLLGYKIFDSPTYQ